MQGRNETLLTTTDKPYGFSLKLWQTNFVQGVFKMLPLTETATRAVNRDILKKSIASHLEMLQQRFKSYFPDLNILKYDWVRNPFNQSTLSNASKLKLKAQEQLAEICMEPTLQPKYNQLNIKEFLLIARQEYTEISQAVQIIFPFSTTYLCESVFSSSSEIKIKILAKIVEVNEEFACLYSTAHQNDLCSKISTCITLILYKL